MLNKDLIILNFETNSNDKFDILKNISNVLSEKINLNNDILLSSLIEREKISPTAIGENIAIPHAKIENLANPHIAIIKLDKIIKWDIEEDEDVDLLIIMIMPKESKENIHLQIMSKIARNIFNDEFIDTIRHSNNIDKIYDITKKIIES